MIQLPLREINLFDLTITDIPVSGLIDVITNSVKNDVRRRIYYVNIHGLNIAYQCPLFRQCLGQGDLVFCDGYGVKIAASLLKESLLHRNTPPDWIDALADACNVDGISLFLLGDEEGVASETAEKLMSVHPGLRIVGSHNGFFSKRGKENELVLSKINNVSPEILLVGMGMPLQEFWTNENHNKLDVKVIITLGAAFRWYCGIEKRAPKWVTDNGFEWMARLSRHPIKLFGRYVIGNPLFFWRVMSTYWFGRKLPIKCNTATSLTCSTDCHFKGKD